MKSQSQGSKPAKDKDDGARTQFGKKDWEVLLSWLEADGHLDEIGGSKGKIKIGGKFPNKKQAYQALATYINDNQYKGSTLKPLTWEMARNRYTYLCTLHKRAKQASESIGFGLTDVDVAKGLRTIEEKLDKLCPCYERVNHLIGGTPRTELKLNTLSSHLGGSSDEQLPWTMQDNEGGAENGETIVVSDENSTKLNGEAVANDQNSATMEEDQEVASIKQGGPGLSPTTPTASQTPLPVPENPLHSPAPAGLSPANSTPEPCDTSTVGAPKRPTKLAPMKSKFNKAGTYPNKKPQSGKGQSVCAAFSSGMEAISLEKVKANEIKERTVEFCFANLQADRALRASTAQRRLDIEEQRMKIDEIRVVQDEKNSIREARLRIVSDKAHRTPEEVIAILQAFTALPP